MEVARHALLRRVEAHGRDDDAVRHLHPAQPEGLEHGRLGRVRARSFLRHHAPHLLHEFRRAEFEVVPSDGLGARHDAEGEAGGMEVPEAADLLEPHQRHVGRVLRLLHVLAPRSLEALQAGWHVAAVEEGLVQRDGILHRELRAAADGEVRGRLGVAEQHDVAARPARAADHGKAPPQRAVGDERVPLQVLREHALQEARALLLAHVPEAGAGEGVGVRLQHPGRAARLVLVAVRDEDAVLGLAEEECEGAEGPRGAHPGEAVGAEVHLGREVLAVAFADRRVDAVGRDDQVGVGEVLRARVAAELQLHAEAARALLQEQQQRAARAAAETVAADAVRQALGDDLDVVPVGEGLGDGAVARLVRRLEGVERRVAEHHAEAEGVVGRVALHDGDARGREVALHQDGEVQAGGAAADHRDAHREDSSRSGMF